MKFFNKAPDKKMSNKSIKVLENTLFIVLSESIKISVILNDIKVFGKLWILGGNIFYDLGHLNLSAFYFNKSVNYIIFYRENTQIIPKSTKKKPKR